MIICLAFNYLCGFPQRFKKKKKKASSKALALSMAARNQWQILVVKGSSESLSQLYFFIFLVVPALELLVGLTKR